METPELKDARNVEHLPRKASGNKQSQSVGVTNKVIGTGLLKTFGIHISLLCSPDAGHVVIESNGCLAAFRYYFDPITSFYAPIPSCFLCATV